MWKCPECDEEIDNLKYDVDTNSSEYGTASLSDTKQTHRHDIIEDHESDDYGDSEWSGDANYRCPECDEDINPGDLIWVGDNEEDDEEKPKIKKEPELEETLHKIISPTKNIIKNDLPKTTEDSIICKNPKCRHVFIINTGTYHGNDDDEIFECPRCATSNTIGEYKQLLNNGYYR